MRHRYTAGWGGGVDFIDGWVSVAVIVRRLRSSELGWGNDMGIFGFKAGLGRSDLAWMRSQVFRLMMCLVTQGFLDTEY